MEDKRTTGDPRADSDLSERSLTAEPRAPRLLIIAANGTWSWRPLPSEGAFAIGRDTRADIHLDESAVSHRHARLEVSSPGELRLVDLRSANGTLVGGKLVRDGVVPVQPNEPILIGSTLLVVHDLPPACTSRPGPRPHPMGLVMADLDELVAKFAPTMSNVLLLGETGVGKGVIAERIHRLSARTGPLMQLNCAGLAAALLESELFGHERGAFTGAAVTKVGLLEAAAGGTVFLDEVGEMPLEVQAKLLLAIEQRVTRRVGATRTMPIDVRFISATHRDLQSEIRDKRFRADFYYRIGHLSIHIPPLRERRDEIDGLVAQFVSDAAARLGRASLPIFDDDVRAWLHRCSWPGNIRELRNFVERALLFAENGVVTSRSLAIAGLPADMSPSPHGSTEAAERERVIDALAACGGNQSRAARMLGVARNTLIRWIQKYNLERPRLKALDGRSPSNRIRPRRATTPPGVP